MKNRSTGKTRRFVIFLLAVSCLSFIFACQKSQLAEYRKYANVADVPRISVADAKKDVDAGIALIVDSRAADAYKNEHIAGAINIQYGTPTDKFSELPKKKKIIVYCS